MLQAEYTQECQKGGGVLGREWEKVSERERVNVWWVREIERNVGVRIGLTSLHTYEDPT